MKNAAITLASLLLLGSLPALGFAQDKPKTDEKSRAEAQATTPIKVQIVFAEFDGDKKVKSLPYALYVNAADAPELRPGWTKVRIGSRVPVYTGGPNGGMTYIDVGTNIDARAAHTGEGRFLLYLHLDRSWVEGEAPVPVLAPTSQTPHAGEFREPIIRQFSSELDLKLREGQTIESNMSTDPISGKVMRVEVSLSVVK